MRLIVTSDLHFDHAKSTALAKQAIEEINRMGGDVLLLVGDTATPEGDTLERCLSLFDFAGPKLFVAGNHELWMHDGDSYVTYTTDLPSRVRALGWQWLEDEPFRAGDIAIVGSVGWYDYSFAQPALQIPIRFYREKVSPGAVKYLPELAYLLAEKSSDVPPEAMEIVARWNDGRFVRLGRTDEQFLHELIEKLDHQLLSCITATAVVAAIHHLPFSELLPPPHSAQWDFTKAYLGAERLGQTLLKYYNVRHCFCGHSHFPAEATIGHIHALNPGSGYRVKRFATLDL
jgi:predicted phosphodiesterase